MDDHSDKSNSKKDIKHEGDDTMPPRRRLSTRLLAVAGIVVALIIVLLLAVRISPTAKLALYTICSFCVMIVCLEVSFKGAVLTWIASALLGVLFIGVPAALPYCGFFGPWPLLKGVIERRFCESRGTLWIGYVIKILIFIALVIAIYFLFNALIVPFIALWQTKFGVPVVVLGLGTVMLALIYDVILTGLLMEYCRRIRPLIFRGK
ncbi:MAG: hypothetical protein ACOYCB_05335 [Fastidiosipilaceae bacterium]|jgi:hypothetical protein|nr:hypothetical protein [Clostridiaceae bacterium]